MVKHKQDLMLSIRQDAGQTVQKPRTASMENQITIIGPKELPTTFVPYCCIKKSTAKIIRTIAITGIPGLIQFQVLQLMK